MEPVIVYLEDDRYSREVLELVLCGEMAVCNLTIFEDSTNFMERLEILEQTPNMFFLDIHVKPHTGFIVLDMLRKDPQYKNAIIVALTASVMNEEVQRLKTAGFNGVIAKPIDMDTFPDMFRRLLKGEKIWRIVG
jgi:CheY-like chemotaxis protein